MSYDWLLLERAYAGLDTPERITLLTVNGTGVTMWDGPPADTARALGDERWLWQPIGYPSATLNMLASRQAGEQELVRQILLHPGKIVLAGYSQGALITGTVWRDHILNPTGDLHHRLGDVSAIIHWGDPMRCPGIARGNQFAGLPMPSNLDGQTTGGIAGPDCLTAEQTPDFLLSFCNNGDLYAAAPVGADPWHAESEVGKVEKLIYDIIQQATFLDVMAVAGEILKAVFMPMAYLIPLIQAIANGILFFGAGMNAPHYHYPIDGAVGYLRQRSAAILA